MELSHDFAEHELGLARSPRSTWIWARNEDDTVAARAAIDAAGGLAHWGQAFWNGEVLENVSDIDIGADAQETTEALEAAGFTLRVIENPPWVRDSIPEQLPTSFDF